MEKMTEAVTGYLNAQIDSGADAVQIFDSWGGLLSAADYSVWVLPHMKTLVKAVKRPGVPVIIYVNGSSHLVETLSATKCDVLSVDWRTVLTTAAKRCKSQTAIQGNLDPLSLYGDQADIRSRAKAIMAEMDAIKKGHVFNLGHGILPTTPEDSVKVLVETVHKTSPKRK